MSRTYRIVGILVVLAMILSLAPMAVFASRPTEVANRGISYRPPAPWLTQDGTLDGTAQVTGKGAKSVPVTMGTILAQATLGREPGDANPRAARILRQNELAAFDTTKAATIQAAVGPAKLLVIPVEFTATQVFTVYSGAGCTNVTTETVEGPLHNEIADPAGTTDNHTFWVPDFSQELFQHLFFDVGPTGGITVPVRTDLYDGAGTDLTGLTAANYYLEQSKGVYWLEGYVTPWMQLPVSEGQFGADGNECQLGGTDGRNGQVYNIVISATDALNAYWLATYGKDFPWKEYDVNGDGIVDHLMIIHAGEDQSAGGGDQGDYSIWAHSSDVNAPFGYVVDSDNNIKVMNYTVVPENADIGVIAHEFGHDIGLPDLYDVTYMTGNSVSFWDLMASGSWNGPLDGMEPAPINLWGRFVLGWASPTMLDTSSPDTQVQVGQLSQTPAGTRDGVIVQLPPQGVSLAEPYSGEYMWWSNNDKNWADTGLLHDFTLPSSSTITLTIMANYIIEEEWDYFFIEVSTDGGTTWTQLPGYLSSTTGQTLTTDLDINGRLHDFCAARGGAAGCALSNGLTGSSGGDWLPIAYNLTPFAGQNIKLRLSYLTDAASLEMGIFVDDIAIDVIATDQTTLNATWFFDDVESGMDGWVSDNKSLDTIPPGGGWMITNGTFVFPHYYLAEWRNSSGFDRGLAYAYYYQPNLDTVERVPYEVPGMLLWYRNYRYSQNTPYPYLYDDPSYGDKSLLLVVDSHPWPYRWDPQRPGYPFSNVGYTMQTRDAVFSLQPTHGFTLTNRWWPDVVQTFDNRPAVDQFHDSIGYYAGLGLYGDDPDNDTWWESLGSSVVIPAKCFYWPRWDANPYWEDLGNPGLCNYGVHIGILSQAGDGSWGLLKVWNNTDTFLSRKLVSNPYPANGEVVTFTIILKDAAGSDLADTAYTYDADMYDYIPEGSEYVSGSLTFSGHGDAWYQEAGNAIMWGGYLGGEALAEPDAVITYSVIVYSGIGCNAARVGNFEPTEMGYLPREEYYDLTTAPCGTEPYVDLVKTVDRSSVKRGGIMTYTLTFTNNGTVAAYVLLNDHTPAFTSYVVGSVTGGASFTRDDPHPGPSIGNIYWIGWLEVGESVTITFQVMVDQSAPGGSTITNIALLYVGEGLSSVVRAEATATVIPTNWVFIPYVFGGLLQ